MVDLRAYNRKSLQEHALGNPLATADQDLSPAYYRIWDKNWVVGLSLNK